MKNLLSHFDHWTLFSILAALNVLDAATTAILVAKFGADVEANPVMRQAIYQYGIAGLYMLKFVVVGFLGLVLAYTLRYYRKHRASTMVKRCMWVLNAMLLFIVVNNAILVVATINT